MGGLPLILRWECRREGWSGGVVGEDIPLAFACLRHVLRFLCRFIVPRRGLLSVACVNGATSDAAEG